MRSILQDIKIFCFVILLESPGIGLTEMGHKYALLFWSPLIVVIGCLWQLRSNADFRRLAPELRNSDKDFKIELLNLAALADEQLKTASAQRDKEIRAALDAFEAEIAAINEKTKFSSWSIRSVLLKGISVTDQYTDSLARFKAVLDAQP